ncbi:hypothetical protein LCGC14_0844600 [marine sediment metagenome]|uniref:Uncharacterized protein n=1 Tax=marine sediment metagenome TaxID=412755 RepID=A0A0F9RWS8_9ZZZZ
MTDFLNSKQVKWVTIRDTIAHDALDTTLAVTGRKWADRPTHITESDIIPIRKIPIYLNQVILRFRMTTSITNVTYKVWLYREDDDAMYVANGLATKGTQTATKTNGTTATLYADTITVAAERWIGDVKSTDTSGNNEMAMLALDAFGAFLPYVEMTAVTGTGSVSVDMAGV